MMTIPLFPSVGGAAISGVQKPESLLFFSKRTSKYICLDGIDDVPYIIICDVWPGRHIPTLKIASETPLTCATLVSEVTTE